MYKGLRSGELEKISYFNIRQLAPGCLMTRVSFFFFDQTIQMKVRQKKLQISWHISLGFDQIAQSLENFGEKNWSIYVILCKQFTRQQQGSLNSTVKIWELAQSPRKKNDTRIIIGQTQYNCLFQFRVRCLNRTAAENQN